ncbi:PcfJ domain-containing protein [Bosea sp. RAC05]|uniref:PcfJ domain-containing protein n=1 Tax=Bosea sp. RAC05 TaxID=1842539 RepID=UPI0008556C3A|nr:PcfJ domain-containing protein [Bosea sp. RAC05]AOG02896.1 hypothetical protein BSY19_5087 [Bosea sp. RAC05]
MREVAASLAPSAVKLRNLVGFVECVAAIAEVAPKSLRTANSLARACQAIAKKYVDTKAIAAVVAIKEGNRTVGHRVAGPEDAVAIAHAVAHRRALPVQLHGPFVPALAKKSGLRLARVRPLSKDPAVDAMMRFAVTDFAMRRTSRFVSGHGSGWHSALLLQSEGSAGPVFKVLAVSDPGCTQVHIAELVMQRDHAGFTFTDAGDQALRAAVDQAILAGRETKFGVEDVVPMHDHVRNFLNRTSPLLDEVDRKRLIHVIRRAGAIGNQAAIAKFRRSLSEQLQRYASRVGGAFVSFEAIEKFLLARAGWDEQHYTRMNQAFSVLKWLDPKKISNELVHLITAGRPIEEVIRLRCKLARPLHPKAVKVAITMRGKLSAPAAALIACLDALYKHDPHVPLLGRAELAAISLVIQDQSDRSSLLADIPRILLAHRDDDGRFCYPGKGLQDVYGWMARSLNAMDMQRGIVRFKAGAASLDALFPAGRRVHALKALNERWHASITSDSEVLRKKIEAIRLNHRVHADEDEDMLMADLYPHPMSAATTVAGVAITPLVTEDAIFAEGHKMNHCVASFVADAASGACFLVSLTCDEGSSTAELRLTPYQEGDDISAEWRLEIVQHLGPGNVDPLTKHVSALEGLLRQIGLETLPALAERVERAHASAETLSDVKSGALTIEGQTMIADLHFEAVKSYLPNHWRRMGRRMLVDYLVQNYALDEMPRRNAA